MFVLRSASPRHLFLFSILLAACASGGPVGDGEDDSAGGAGSDANDVGGSAGSVGGDAGAEATSVGGAPGGSGGHASTSAEGGVAAAGGAPENVGGHAGESQAGASGSTSASGAGGGTGGKETGGAGNSTSAGGTSGTGGDGFSGESASGAPTQMGMGGSETAGTGGQVADGGAGGAGGQVADGGAGGAGGQVADGGAAGVGGQVADGGAGGVGGQLTSGGAGGVGGQMTTGDSCASPTVVISEIYGGGGNSEAIYDSDYVVLFNRGGASVDLSGWSVQYASKSGTSWSVTALKGSIAAGAYYLVKENGNGGGGASLPSADVTGALSISSTDGKVALVSSGPALSGDCPGGSGVVDMVGFGVATCPGGNANAPAPSNTTSIQREGAGCIVGATPAASFQVTTPSPRTSTSAAHACAACE